jgi:hypothetical protein
LGLLKITIRKSAKGKNPTRTNRKTVSLKKKKLQATKQKGEFPPHLKKMVKELKTLFRK